MTIDNSPLTSYRYYIAGFLVATLCFACAVFQYRKAHMERLATARAQNSSKITFKEFSTISCSALSIHMTSEQCKPRSLDDLCDILIQHQTEITKIRRHIPFSPDVERIIQQRCDPWGTNFFVDIHTPDENNRLYIVTVISAGSDKTFMSDIDYEDLDKYCDPVMVGEMGKEDWIIRLPVP